MRAAILCVALFSLTVACGGTSPGGGTKTLFVKAQAQSDGSSDGSWMALEIRDGSSSGSLITDAVVVLRGDKTGEFTLPWQGVNWGDFKAGSYFKSGLAWDSGWSLEVRRGNDRLDARLEAPGMTVITEPIGGTTYRRVDGVPLTVKWKDDSGHRAMRVRVTLDKAGFDRTLTEDPVLLAIEPNLLTAEDKEKVRVERWNEVELAGGTAGSSFKVETHHQIEFRVE